MKNMFAAIAVILLMGSAVPALEQQGPRIEIKELRHDLGKVAQGTPASYLFEVKSVGSEPLVIERVAST